MWRSEKKNSPGAVSHLLLHRRTIQSQLGHLTTDALEHGKKITSLSLQKVRHHVRQLGVTQWASALTAHYKEDHMTDGISSQTADASSFISFPADVFAHALSYLISSHCLCHCYVAVALAQGRKSHLKQPHFELVELPVHVGQSQSKVGDTGRRRWEKFSSFSFP